MAPDPAITGFTDQLVADCGLDTASIFFCTGTGPAAAIAYVHHVNVSAAAQHSYINHGVFRSDPFIQLTHAAVAADGSGFIRWGDRRLDPLADQLPDYRAFLFQHDVAVVGALGRRLAPELTLIIGTHRSARLGRSEDVPLPLLEHRLGKLADAVTGDLLARMLDHEAGQMAMHNALAPAGQVPGGLTARETEIARWVCQGLRNKEIAWRSGISEFTVENHLRRIYRKLGIHNRAALVAQVSHRLRH
jgi:DNA-binding CsgD family transcriptional regulator